jgi:hypothetical protein
MCHQRLQRKQSCGMVYRECRHRRQGRITRGKEHVAVALSLEAGCEGGGAACAALSRRTFVPGGACAISPMAVIGPGNAMADATAATTLAFSSGGGCLLAPRAVGMAHQAGHSRGYDGACTGVLCAGSPCMWLPAWSTNVLSQSLAHGT